jgi:hypothetical protein
MGNNMMLQNQPFNAQMPFSNAAVDQQMMGMGMGMGGGMNPMMEGGMNPMMGGGMAPMGNMNMGGVGMMNAHMPVNMTMTPQN